MRGLYPVFKGELQGEKQFTVHNPYGDVIAYVTVTVYDNGAMERFVEIVDKSFSEVSILNSVLGIL